MQMVFASALLVLAVISATYYIREGRNHPVILPSPSPNMPGTDALPENHPPINNATELAALEQMSRESPQNPDYRTRIGNIYYDMGEYGKAATAYEQSLALNPKDPGVQTDLATCLHYLGQHDKALELIDRVLSENANFEQALFNKGVILLEGKKDKQGAAAAWEALLGIRPDLPQRSQLEERIRQLRADNR